MPAAAARGPGRRPARSPAAARRGGRRSHRRPRARPPGQSSPHARRWRAWQRGSPSFGRRKRMHLEDVLAAQPEGGAAGRQHREALDAREQPGDPAGVLEEAIEAVEHEQRRADATRAHELVSQLLGRRRHHTERGRGFGREQAGVLDAVEVDVHRATAEALRRRAEPPRARPGVFPTPPGPTSVRRRMSGRTSRAAISATSLSRPIRSSGRRRQRTARLRAGRGRRSAPGRARGSCPPAGAAPAPARCPARRPASAAVAASPRAPRPAEGRG